MRGFFNRAFSHRFGERVAVGPAQCSCAFAAGSDELLGDPFPSAPVGVVRDGDVAAASVFAFGVTKEFLEAVRHPA